MNTLIQKIFSKQKETPNDASVYIDLLDACKLAGDYESAKKGALMARKNVDSIPMYEAYRKLLLLCAPHDLDAYLLYLEQNRPVETRFYEPRRKVLKQVVDALQGLVDDKLDELFLSMPPRVGKTSLMIFFMSWKIGRDSEHPNLYSSYSDRITKAFYNGVLEIINDTDTYLWHDVFPESKTARTNADEETIDIDRRKHYPSLTCRAIEGTLNGACDAQDGVIIADDLVADIEEAMSKDRLISKWSRVDNNLIPRGKGKTKYLWIGTRWSVIDPAGIRMDLLANDERFADYRYKVINLPALDSNDESNFDYPFNVGFDTLYYQRRRASFERNNDMASWLAQYMGQPIEREGTLFTPYDFRYYNGELPENPDRIFMAVDPAFGGGDFVAGPVCYQYGDDIYVPAVIYDNSDKRITQPQIASLIERYNITWVQFEANKSIQSFATEVDNLLKEKDIKINITTKPAKNTMSKETRILDKAPEIRERMIFLEDGKRDRQYSLFMQNVFSFKLLGKNKHDDAPDSLAMAMDMIVKKHSVEIFRRPF